MPELDFDKLQEMLGDVYRLTEWQMEVLQRWADLTETGGTVAVTTRRNGMSDVVKAKPSTRGRRVPEGYVPPRSVTDQMMDEYPHVTQQEWLEQHRQFMDYWVAVPGQRGCKLSWDATWRNWMRKEFSKPQYRRRAPTQGRSRVDAKAASYLED